MAGAIIRSNTVSMGTAVTLWSTHSLVFRHVTLVTRASVGSNTVGIHAITNRFTDGTVLFSVTVRTSAGIRSSTGGIDAGLVTYRDTVEVLICSVALIAFEAMR